MFPRQLRQGLPSRATLALALAVVAGLGSGVLPDSARWLASLAVLSWLAWCRPEVVLALFLTAGAYKQNAAIASAFPGDPTVVLAAVLLFGVVGSMRAGGFRVPHAAILLLPVLLLAGIGAWGAGTDYGTAKALRFGTLTLLGMLGCLTLLRRTQHFTSFMVAICLVAGIVTMLAAFGQQTDSTARLRMAGTSPITLARMSVITLTFCWLSMRLVGSRLQLYLLLPVALLSIYVAVATGSRSPVLSLVLGGALLEWFARRHHSRSLVPLYWIVGIGAIVMVLAVSGIIPAGPLSRFQLALTIEGDRSISQRLMLYQSGLDLLVHHPFGIGIGGFSEHAILNLRYPHNIFLETGVELGWIPMLSLLTLCVWSFWTLIGVMRRSCSWTTCLLVMLVVMSGINAFFTGDFNDNRMFFALLLVPFLYRSSLSDSEEYAPEAPPDRHHAIHLASHG